MAAPTVARDSGTMTLLHFFRFLCCRFAPEVLASGQSPAHCIPRARSIDHRPSRRSQLVTRFDGEQGLPQSPSTAHATAVGGTDGARKSISSGRRVLAGVSTPTAVIDPTAAPTTTNVRLAPTDAARRVTPLVARPLAAAPSLAPRAEACRPPTGTIREGRCANGITRPSAARAARPSCRRENRPETPAPSQPRRTPPQRERRLAAIPKQSGRRGPRARRSRRLLR